LLFFESCWVLLHKSFFLFPRKNIQNTMFFFQVSDLLSFYTHSEWIALSFHDLQVFWKEGCPWRDKERYMTESFSCFIIFWRPVGMADFVAKKFSPLDVIIWLLVLCLYIEIFVGTCLKKTPFPSLNLCLYIWIND
jgi:hypothetical protein